MVTDRTRAIADTSVFIGIEADRFDAAKFQDFEWAVSVVTLGELQLGVIKAQDPAASARRLETLQLAARFSPLPVDEEVSKAWALLVAQLHESGRKVPINDSWIAATAIRHKVPVVTQDRDYAAFSGLEVIQLLER